MKFRAALFAVLLLTLPAWGAGQLEALRASAKAARDQAGAVRSEQMEKRQELNRLSARIETLKAAAKGKLLSGNELDAALKNSQELSGVLTGLAQTMSARESELEAANLALLEALSQQLTQLRADFDRQSDRQARQRLLHQFKALRAEREQVRAALPAAKVPALEALKFSDDPSELLEQADAVRDDEDKVQRELKVLEHRIAEAKAEKDLDGRVRQFLGEESLFDDQDRRLRLTTSAPAQLSGLENKGAAGSPIPAPSYGGQAPGTQSSFSATDSTGAAGPSRTQPPPAGASEGPPATPSIPSNPSTPPAKVTSGSDARPTFGAQRIAGGDDDDLEELEVQRLRLQGLAGQLRSRASELEKKAAELK